MIKAFAERTHEKMKDVLMNPSAVGPDIHYYMIRGGIEKKNITVWESGTVGGEYIKAYGHYHVGDLEEDYEIIAGEGMILLQSPIQNDSVENFTAIKVKAGDKIHIPKNTGHLALNTGKTWFVTSDNSPVNFEEKDPVSLPGHADYESVKKMKGFAYYVIEENGVIKFLPNPLYKNIPQVDLK